MGSYVSVVRCRSDYGMNITCNGTVTKGTVPPNPDVAGIGVRFFPLEVLPYDHSLRSR